MRLDQQPAPSLSAGSTGVRLGALFGPSVFGVTAAGLALPDVVSQLGTSASTVTWVLTVHALALGIGIAYFGRWFDAAGGRVVLAVGSALLLVGTCICLFAPALPVLVAGRLCLGAGSGAMAAASLALVGSIRQEDRATVLAVFGGAMALFSACAALAGGVVTDALSWRVTLVLPALSLLAVPGCWRLVRRGGSGQSVDQFGAGCLTVIAASVLVLFQAPVLGLNAAVLGVVVTAGGVAGVLLVRHVRRTPAGFVPASLVRDPLYAGAVAVGAGTYGGLFSVMFVVPQVLTEVHSWSVLTVGVLLLPGAVVGALLSRLAGRFASGRGGKVWATGTAATFGTVLAVAGFLSPNPVALVIGASLGFAAFSVVQVAVTGFMTGYLRPEQRGGGLGLLNLTFFVGGAAGSATAGVLLGALSPAVTIAVLALFPLVGATGFALLEKRARE